MRYPAPGMPVECVIHGTELSLRYPLRVMKQLDHEHGISFMRGGDNIAASFQDPEKFAILLHAGLSSDHPEITLDWVEDNVEASLLADLMPLLVYAASGRKIIAEDEDEPVKNEQSGEGLILTGSLSGRSVGTT